MSAIDDIRVERTRQTTEEGWSEAHDDQHDSGELARAAACYAEHATDAHHVRVCRSGDPPSAWPWSKLWWKPSSRRRDLVKAGALIVAEIERLDRAEERAGKQ